MIPATQNVPGSLAGRIEALAAQVQLASPTSNAAEDARRLIDEFLTALEAGTIRAAVRSQTGAWSVVPWIKRGILAAFRVGVVVDQSPRDPSGGRVPPFSFFDKDTLPPRHFSPSDGVRLVPGGSTIRRGAHLDPGVVCMPPAYINVGAYVARDTMIDSHALIGSCAQIGERVHVSAGTQIGGVLEPIGAVPVIIEDDVVIGGNCGLYEGVLVRARAVLGAGVVMTRATPVYDLVRETVYRAETDRPLEIPEGAVVVPGARQVASAWGTTKGLAIQTPVVVKYRDDRTDQSTVLEAWLR